MQAGYKKLSQKCLDNHKEEVQQNIIIKNDINLRKIQYNVRQIDHTNGLYYAAQISDNEYYIAYGGLDQVLKIYDLKHNKLLMKIQFNLSIFLCQFTSDSRYLYVGCCFDPEIQLSEFSDFALIYCYSVQKDFKKLLQFKIKSRPIYSLTTIKNKCLIIGGYNAITQVDFRCKKQIFQFITHQDIISTLEYDQINNMVISGSYDHTIKIWDLGRRKLIINKITELQIWQIQLIDQNKYLLSLDEQSNLYKWRIDEKDLTKLQQITDPNIIFYFRQIQSNDDAYMLLICSDYVKILDSKGEVVNMFNHTVGYYIECIANRQLDNLKYIYIPAKGIKIVILDKILLAVMDD